MGGIMDDSKYIEIVDWGKFQHYKHRNPPWIKLYSYLLDNDEFDCMQDASKMLYFCLLLFASRRENKIKLDFRWLQKKLPIENPITQDTIQPLIDNGFITCKHHASKVIAGRKQNASPEKSREEESKEEKRRDRVNRQNAAVEEKKPLPIDSHVTCFKWFVADLHVDVNNDREKKTFMKYARLCSASKDADFNYVLTDMVMDLNQKVKNKEKTFLESKRMFSGWIVKRFPNEFKKRP